MSKPRGAMLLLGAVLLGLLAAAYFLHMNSTESLTDPIVTLVLPTPVVQGKPATSVDTALISNALTTTRGLKSYHLTVQISGETITQPFSLEGDFLAPDKAYLRGQLPGGQTELLMNAGRSYTRDSDGRWSYRDASSGTDSPSSPMDLAKDSNIFNSLEPFLFSGTQFMDLGTPVVDGVGVRHFRGTVSTAALLENVGGDTDGIDLAEMSLGAIQLWIDPHNNVIRQIILDLDLGPFINTVGSMVTEMEEMHDPGTPTATPFLAALRVNITVVISRPNDPSIQIPTPPANVDAAPTLIQ